MKLVLVNCEPWSELKISGLPYFASAYLSASTQNPASIEFDNRQLSTFRLCQSMAATKYRNPKSLRAEEMARPVTLEARIRSMKPVANDLWQALHAALPLVRAVGADRTRGLGRCIVTARDAVGAADE